MTHLFLFTLGPVQSFIAQARKTHDLYSSSRILSRLCKVAADAFLSNKGSEIIFPNPQSASIPNRFLGKITTGQDLKKIGDAVAHAVKNEWQKRFDQLPQLLSGAAGRDAQDQIDNHLDIQWLFMPLADDQNETYINAYDDINKKLNAIKNTRSFHTSNEVGRKCSLDGERNVIFYRKSFSQKNKDRDDLQKGNPLYSSHNLVFEYKDISQFQLRHLQPGEGLSAVSMLKRYTSFDGDFKANDFPSTAEFALADTMKVAGGDVLQQMTSLFGHDDSKHLNWQLFFEENLNEKYFEKQGYDTNLLEPAKGIHDQLKSQVEASGRKFEKYYALVVFDGDKMGEWWKGTRLKDGISLESFHQKLAANLAIFAKKVREEYPNGNQRGWEIYAGGDDFLGFFNLHHLVDAIEFLHRTYRELVHEPLKKEISGDFVLTFSAGVCIANYKEPLSLVLDQARALEKSAKKYRETRDAIGLGVIPGSGQISESVLPFEAFPHLGKVITDLQSNNFSNAFVSKARQELFTFTDNSGNLLPELIPTAERLLDRAVSRACKMKQESDETDEAFEKRKAAIVEPLQTSVKALLNSTLANKRKLLSFFDALDIADFIERQTHKNQSHQQHETETERP